MSIGISHCVKKHIKMFKEHLNPNPLCNQNCFKYVNNTMHLNNPFKYRAKQIMYIYTNGKQLK